jgi:hypothetical protein
VDDDGAPPTIIEGGDETGILFGNSAKREIADKPDTTHEILFDIKPALNENTLDAVTETLFDSETEQEASEKQTGENRQPTLDEPSPNEPLFDSSMEHEAVGEKTPDDTQA